MKAREIRELLQGKVDPIFVDTLCALAEDQSVIRQEVKGVAVLVDQMSDIIMNFMGAMEHGARLQSGAMNKSASDIVSSIEGNEDDTGKVS